MALLTDGNPNDTEALRVYEAAILEVAALGAMVIKAGSSKSSARARIRSARSKSVR